MSSEQPSGRLPARTGPTALGRSEAQPVSGPACTEHCPALAAAPVPSPLRRALRTRCGTRHRELLPPPRASALARRPKNSSHLGHPKTCTLSTQARMLPRYMWVPLRCPATWDGPAAGAGPGSWRDSPDVRPCHPAAPPEVRLESCFRVSSFLFSFNYFFWLLVIYFPLGALCPVFQTFKEVDHLTVSRSWYFSFWTVIN